MGHITALRKEKKYDTYRRRDTKPAVRAAGYEIQGIQHQAYANRKSGYRDWRPYPCTAQACQGIFQDASGRNISVYADIEKGNVVDAASAFIAFRENHE